MASATHDASGYTLKYGFSLASFVAAKGRIGSIDHPLPVSVNGRAAREGVAVAIGAMTSFLVDVQPPHLTPRSIASRSTGAGPLPQRIVTRPPGLVGEAVQRS
jgi:hypothetical protein